MGRNRWEISVETPTNATYSYCCLQHHASGTRFVMASKPFLFFVLVYVFVCFDVINSCCERISSKLVYIPTFRALFFFLERSPYIPQPQQKLVKLVKLCRNLRKIGGKKKRGKPKRRARKQASTLTINSTTSNRLELLLLIIHGISLMLF